MQTSVSRNLYPYTNSSDARVTPTYHRNVPAHQSYKYIYYSSDYYYSGAALGVILSFMICILRSDRDFWQLRRDVTLRLFEIGYASMDRMLISAGSRADEVAKNVGRTRVHYEVETLVGKDWPSKRRSHPLVRHGKNDYREDENTQ